MRRIVQIAATMSESDVEAVYALAHDGTLWLGSWVDAQLTWRALPGLPPIAPVKSPEEQRYLHVNGEHLAGLSRWLAWVEQRIESPTEQAPRALLEAIRQEAATARANLAAIRTGAGTA